MLREAPAFSGFSTNDIPAAKAFYADVLGLALTEENGMLTLAAPNGQRVIVYPKPNHEPATFTVLNFEVRDIDAAVDQLSAAGVTFEQYGASFGQDERGVSRAPSGPPIAWFKDPAGNILAVIETGAA